MELRKQSWIQRKVHTRFVLEAFDTLAALVGEREPASLEMVNADNWRPDGYFRIKFDILDVGTMAGVTNASSGRGVVEVA